MCDEPVEIEESKRKFQVDGYQEEEEMLNSRSAVSGIERSEPGARIRIGAASNALIAALIAIALGAATVFVVGFSHSDLLHAAAHDVRHAAGFPCH